MTSKSLEALEELCSRCYVESEKCTCHPRYRGGECSTSCEYKEQIEQDLERLDHLEMENKELKERANSYRKGNQGYCKKVIELEKENKELKERLCKYE